MKNIYEDLRDVLKQNPILDSVPMFFNRMPNEMDELISLFSTAGLSNQGQVDVVYPGFCIKLRSKNPERANLLADELHKMIWANGLKSLTSSSGRKLIFKNVAYPFFLQTDGKERDVYVMNIIVLTEMEGY